MKAKQTELRMHTQNDAILAATLGKIYLLVLRPKGTIVEGILDKAILNQLILQLLTAPDDLLPSC